ncbi:MAG: hypothetical protein NXI27_17145 [Alphaproteobacteria bacterium]|nr:hypothetical protein [Alphaproteobacteria bacterium]
MSFSNLEIPPERFETPAARASLSRRLGLSDHPDIQDWERRFQDFDRIAEFLELYDNAELDDDEKFLLMELILASAGDGDPDYLATPIWQKVEDRLKAHWYLHAWSVWAWSCIDDESFIPYNDFVISPRMQALLLEAAKSRNLAAQPDQADAQTAIAFGTFWWRHFGGHEPTADFLRQIFAERWVRFHSLPESKRYAETDEENREIVRRSIRLAEEVLGSGTPCWMIANRYLEAPPIEDDAVETYSLKPGLAWFRQDEPIEPAEIVAYVKRCNWEPPLFEDLLAKIAADADTGVLWVSANEAPSIFAPYDGGVDLILADSGRAQQLADKYADWLSPYASGL